MGRKLQEGSGVMIRRAVFADLPQLLKIYNYEVLHGTATFDEEARTQEQQEEWFSHYTGKYPLLVEEYFGKIAGYAGACRLFPKPAYDISAEVSVYVAPDMRGQGIGERLLIALLEETKKEPHLESLFSLITATNEASIHLHEKLGFLYEGILRNSGKKFGENLDVMIYRYDLRRERF